MSRVPGGLSVAVANPLRDEDDSRGGDDAPPSNPEQFLALAWSTCLNATAQAVVASRHRTSVRVEVELRDAVDRGGYEFVVVAHLSGEGLDEAAAGELAAAAHQRCPVSRLLHGASTVAVRGEAWRAA